MIASRPTRTKTADRTNLAAVAREWIRKRRMPNDTADANAKTPVLMNLLGQERWPLGPARSLDPVISDYSRQPIMASFGGFETTTITTSSKVGARGTHSTRLIVVPRSPNTNLL